MAVTIDRQEPGIYCIHLAETVQLDELLDAQQRGLDMALKNGDQRYVLILDLDRSIQMPFDIREAGKLIENDRSLKILSVGASLHIRFLASILGRLFGVNRLEHSSTLDHAITRARQILTQDK
ncbi:MAG TPA: hypothetical protein VHL11_22975 [Phototrophicaceae bacterium]|nr:hypothetical protein [Phototrophicaceae bacterium]